MKPAAVWVLSGVLFGCNVSPVGTTGGAHLPARGDCPRGVSVVSSDFQSSEVAVLAPSGRVATSALLSSASTAASGLAAPFSGDIGVAASRTRQAELIVVDRFGTDVLTFVDSETTAVRAQLLVGSGFEANPQDYLELSEHLAVVPRLGDNASPGREAFDAGSDLLLVDPSIPIVIGSVAMPRRAGYSPSPTAVARLGDDVVVTLLHAKPDFSGMAEGELVVYAAADLEPRYRLELRQLRDCGRVEASPNGATWAVACSSFIDRTGAAPDVTASGIVLFDATQDPPTELRRFAAQDLVDGPIQSSVTFVDDTTLLFKTQTALGAAQDNRLFSLDLSNGASTLLATARPARGGSGFGIAFGGMHCGLSCSDPCLVADASHGVVLRFSVDHGALAREPDIEIGGAGLPPVSLTPFW